MQIEVNKPFDGSELERARNRDTHIWIVDFDGEIHCDRCSAKPWHIAASWPCGETPEMVTVQIDDKFAPIVGAPGWTLAVGLEKGDA